MSVMLGVEPSSRQTSSTLSMSFSMHSRRVTSSRMFLLAPAQELFLSYGLKPLRYFGLTHQCVYHR